MDEVEVRPPAGADAFEEILTKEAVELIRELQSELGPRRKELLMEREVRAHARDAGSRAKPMAELGWKQVEKILRRAA